MAIKKIELNEEFQFNGNIFRFSKEEGKVKLCNLGPAKKGRVQPSNYPTEKEVIEFFKMKGYNEDAARKFYDFYGKDIEPGQPWKDSKGNLVKNWKMKAKSVWFREENKIKEEQTLKKTEGFLF